MKSFKSYLNESRVDSDVVQKWLKTLAKDEGPGKTSKFYTALANRIEQSFPTQVTFADIEKNIAREPAFRRLWNKDDWEFARDQIEKNL